MMTSSRSLQYRPLVADAGKAGIGGGPSLPI
jgi:hypothetical protein